MVPVIHNAVSLLVSVVCHRIVNDTGCLSFNICDFKTGPDNVLCGQLKRYINKLLEIPSAAPGGGDPNYVK